MSILWTGERFIPGVRGDIELEHFHRYRIASQLSRELIVLDIACGEGYGSALIAKSAKYVYGIDISIEAIAHAKHNYSAHNVKFMVGSCEKIPLDDCCADIVVSFETIEHHDKHHEMLSEILRVLKPDGLLIISSPDRDEYAKTRTGDNEFHVKELSTQEFADLLKNYFNNIDIYSQKVVNASAISPADDTSLGEFKHIISTKLGDVEQRHIHRNVYNVALAANVDTLPSLGTSLYEIDNSDLSFPQAGSIRVDLLINDCKLYSAHFNDLTLPNTSATIPFDTRIHEIELKIPSDFIFPERIGVVPTDQPCALALHECSFFSSDNRLLWKWDGLQNPFNLSNFAVFIPGKDKTPALIVSLGNYPIAWFNLPDEVLHELHGGLFQLRAAGFTLYDSQILNRLNSYISDNIVVGNGNESGQLLSLDAQSGFLGKLSLQTAAQQSSILQDLEKKLLKVQLELKRAETQLELLKDLWLANE